MWWCIDGNNVMGAAADGWWNAPEAAMARLAETIAEWCRTHDDEVTLVFDRPAFDGAPVEAVAMAGGGNLTVTFATRRGRDAADDRIVELVEDRFADATGQPEVTVVTSDRGLIGRLPPGVTTMGNRTFRVRLGV